MADYYTLLTNAGIAYETACKAAGLPIKLSQISVGDGGGSVYNPAATATALKREVWRGPLNALFQDDKNPSWLLAEVTIPPDVGGWYVREAGLWTDTGILYAIVKYPESFKPVLATSGSGKEFYIRSIFETSNAALVTLLIDDSVVKATRAWVMSYLAEELGKLDGKQSVRVAATGNLVLNGAQQIDGVAAVAGDRVLLANQTLAKDNGLWVVSNGAWTRAADANTSAKVTPGLTVMVEEGTANGDSLWHLTTNGPITLDSTALTFEMLAGRTGIQPGTYKSLNVDKYGRATGGSNPETLAGFGIKDTYTKPEIESLISKASALPVGSIVAFPVDSPPPGFLELDNSVKSSATYPDLSAYLAGKFNKGDEGVGNFRLPEARGEFLRGWDHGRGVDVGRGLGTFQDEAFKAHNHRYFDGTAATMDPAGGWQAGAINGAPASISAGAFLSGVDGGITMQLVNAGNTVNAGGAETRPRNLAVMWCIKAWNAPINQGSIDVAALVKEVERLKSAVPVGAVLSFPMGIVAPGYLELDGSVQSTAVYPDLAAYLGTTFNKGDEGAGNFRLPESRGEFLRGWDHGRGVDPGRTLGSWQKGSGHSFDQGVSAGVVGDRTPSTDAVVGRNDLGYDPATITDYPVAQSMSNSGTGAAIIGSGEISFGMTRPRNLPVMWCIKAWNAPINQGSIDVAALATDVQAMAVNRGVVGDVRNGRMVLTADSATATYTADELVVKDALGGRQWVLPNLSLNINLATIGAGGMDSGTAPAKGYVALYAIYNPVTQQAAAYAVNSTSSVVAEVCKKTMPAGYTASALVAVVATNALGQMLPVIVNGRRHYIRLLSIFTGTVPVTSAPLAMANVIPPNARSYSGELAMSNTTGGAMTINLATGTYGIGQSNFTNSIVAGQTMILNFYDVAIETPQLTHLTTSSNTGSPTFYAYCNGYSI